MNIKRIVFLFVILIILTLSSINPLSSYTRENLQSVLIVYSSEDFSCSKVLENTEIVLEKNDIYYTSFDLSSNYTLPALDNFAIVAIATEVIYHLPVGPQIDLKEYVKNGGRVVQLFRGYSEELACIFGISNTSNPPFVSVEGIKFEKNLFPGLKGIKLSPKIYDDISYNLSLDVGVDVIARSYNGLPLAWENYYGRGKTIFWNITSLFNKDYRGLIIGSITSLLDITVRKVIGSSIIYVDDMPSPSWKAKLEPVKSEYDITDTEYYFKIMLPDLIELSRKYNIKYTTAMIFSYNNLVKPPFNFFEWDNTTLIKDDGTKINVPEEMLKILRNEEAEIGFHGYNHIPFTLTEWKSQANMKKAAESAREKWFSLSNIPPKVYVPPMNINDREGFDAITEAFPSIEIYCSLYTGIFEEGCDREFGRDPWNNNIVSIPRVTSGFVLDDYGRFLALSTLEAFGIWSHFLHPDDIFSTPINYPLADLEWIRNPDSLPWRGEKTGKNGLYYKFESVVKSIKTSYPWLSFETASDAKDKILDYSDSSAFIGVYTTFIDLRESRNSLYIVELPSILTLEKNENFSILSDSMLGDKRRIVIKVKDGCKIYFQAS